MNEMTQERNIGIMVDIETLGLKPNTVVTQIAALVYDIDDPDTHYRQVDEYLPIQPQMTQLGRQIDADTMLFWMQQNDTARKRFDMNTGNDFDELQALVQSVHSKLTQEIGNSATHEVWARGPQFDIAILDSLFGQFGLSAPWRYDRVFDLRTIMLAAGLKKDDVPMPAGLVKHVALHDVKYQMLCLLESWKSLRAKV